MNKVKDIVFVGLEQGWGKKNIIKKIKLMITDENEADRLYKEYRAEYYILK